MPEGAPLEYLRPSTIDEAMEYLQSGIPLAGGTDLAPRRYELRRVVDLRDLGLDQIEQGEHLIRVGSATKLQAILDTRLLPEALRKTCHLEGGWNLRNMATIGGLVMTADGRSPLLTALIALNPTLDLASGGQEVPLTEFLDRRDQAKLITSVNIRVPERFVYEQVARSPLDFPVVACAVAVFAEEAKLGIGLGGFGLRPLRFEKLYSTDDGSAVIDELTEDAQEAFAQGQDQWASSEYRSAVAGILVRRLLREVLSE